MATMITSNILRMIFTIEIENLNLEHFNCFTDILLICCMQFLKHPYMYWQNPGIRPQLSCIWLGIQCLNESLASRFLTPEVQLAVFEYIINIHQLCFQHFWLGRVKHKFLENGKQKCITMRC